MNLKKMQEPKRLKYFNSRLPYPASRPARAAPTAAVPRRDQAQVAAALHQTLGSLHSSSQQKHLGGGCDNGSKGATEQNDGGGPGASGEEEEDCSYERDQR